MPEQVSVYERMRRRQLMGLIDEATSKLGLSSEVREAAVSICERVLSKLSLKGRTFRDVAGAVILMSCKQQGVPCSSKSLAKVLDTRKRAMHRAKALIIRELGLRFSFASSDSLILHMLNQVCKRLRAGERVRLRALEIAREARKESVSSAYPSLAAAAFFISCRENGIRITQEEIAGAFNITAVTLRNVLRRMRERGIIFSISPRRDCKIFVFKNQESFREAKQCKLI